MEGGLLSTSLTQNRPAWGDYKLPRKRPLPPPKDTYAEKVSLGIGASM